MSSAICSVSMSEGEGDGDLEGLAGRVTELTELLQGKEAVVEALHAEIDDLRADVSSPTSSHSQNSTRDTIPMFIAKVCKVWFMYKHHYRQLFMCINDDTFLIYFNFFIYFMIIQS